MKAATDFARTLLGRTAIFCHREDVPKRQAMSAVTQTNAAQKDSGARYLSPEGEIKLLLKDAKRHHDLGQDGKAEELYHEALVLLGRAGGADNSELARCLNNLGRLYHQQQRYADAEPLYKQSLQVVERIFGAEHSKAAKRLANLAELYCAMGRDSEADSCYRRAVAIMEKEYGAEHPNTIKYLKGFATVLRQMRRTAEAETVETMATARLQSAPPACGPVAMRGAAREMLQ
jgi:tetratricopeptide (TPR) repeat protein